MANIVEILIQGKDMTEAAVESARKNMKGLGEDVGKTVGALGKLGGLAVGAGLAAGIAGITASVHAYAEYGEQIEKVRRLTGATAEESSKLIQVASSTGVSIETVTRAMGLLGRNMFEVTQQQDEFGKKAQTNQQILRQLGIEVQNMDGSLRPTTEVLADLADVFHDMPDGAEKSALAMKIFGRSGAEMIPILNQGRQGIDEITASAEKMGLIMSQEDVEAAHQFTLANRNLQSALQGLEIQVGKKVLPGLTQLARAFTEGMESGENFEKFMKGAAFAIAAAWYDAMALVANQIMSVFERVVNLVKDALNWAIEQANSLSNKVPLIGGDILPTIKGEFHMGRAELTDPLAGLKNLFPDITKDVKDFGQEVGDTTPPIKGLGEAAKSTKTALEVMQDGLSLLKSAAANLFADPTRERARLDLNTDKLQYKLDQLADRVQPSLDALKDFKTGLDDTKDRLSNWADDLERRSGVISDAMQEVDDRIRDLQERKGDITKEQDPQGVIARGFDVAINIEERRKRGMELAQRQLDKEEKQRQQQEKALDAQAKLADRKTQQIEREVELERRKLDSSSRTAKIDDDRIKIMKDELTLANQSLLTEKQRDQAFGQLVIDTRNVSARLVEVANKMGASLIPDLDKVHQIAGRSGDVLQAIRDVTEKQEKAAAATDRLATSADHAADSLEWLNKLSAESKAAILSAAQSGGANAATVKSRLASARASMLPSTQRMNGYSVTYYPGH